MTGKPLQVYHAYDGRGRQSLVSDYHRFAQNGSILEDDFCAALKPGLMSWLIHSMEDVPDIGMSLGPLETRRYPLLSNNHSIFV